MAIFLVLSIAGCGASQASTTAAKIDTAIETKAIEPVKEDTTASATPSKCCEYNHRFGREEANGYLY